MSHRIPVPPEVGIGPHITVESEVEAELRELRDRVAVLEAWVRMVEGQVTGPLTAMPTLAEASLRKDP